MKAELVKLRTQFDINANNPRDKIFSMEQQLNRSSIDYSQRVDEITERQFALKPLDINFIKSIALKDDPKFKEIKNIFVKYNEEIVAYKGSSVSGLHLKTVVMEAMLKFLRIMFLAPDTDTKRNILNVAYYWFIKHLNPKQQRKSKETLHKEIKNLVVEHRLMSVVVLQKQLPSEKIKQDLYNYRIRARTSYMQLDAPSVELENYHTHKVGYIADKIEMDPAAEKEKRRRLRWLRVQFKKPILQTLNIMNETVQSSLAPTQLVNPLTEDKSTLGANLAPVPAQTVPKPTEPVAVVPANEQQQLDACQQDIGVDLDIDPDQPPQEVPEEEQVKKGKLDPFVKAFVLKRQVQRQKVLQCVSIDQHIRKKINVSNVQERQDYDFSQKVCAWASKRSRFKSQMSRKIQSVRAFNNSFLNKTVNDKNLLQKTINESRINQNIKDSKRYIKGELVRENLNTDVGLSIFDRRRTKTETFPKHFSHILEQNKRANKQEEYLRELQEIKNKFAKHKISTAMSMMRGTFLHPEELDQTHVVDKVEYPTMLPSNPFFVVKKKKKGKKKK